MTATIPVVAPAAPVQHKWMITISVMLAAIMQALDTTIANVALPHMQGSMSATHDQISWVLTSYIVAAAIAMPLTGFVSDRFGRKRLFVWSVVGFTLTSMLCGAAQNLPQIVTFRILQGIFGAALVPLSQSVLLDVYPKEKHASAMALWGIGIMLGPIIGPTLGGWLTEYYSWRWVFYINLIFGIMALVGILAFVKETKIRHDRRFDLLGFAFLSLGIGALQLMLDRGETQDWFNSHEIIIELTLVILGFYWFISHTVENGDELRAKFMRMKTINEYVLNLGIVYRRYLTSNSSVLATLNTGPMYIDTETDQMTAISPRVGHEQTGSLVL
ncbi:MAG: DHA2 family efflux MFS transporter permease subunit, partial [Moraxellaceae bacterium]